jgi:hypothetical protein
MYDDDHEDDDDDDGHDDDDDNGFDVGQVISTCLYSMRQCYYNVFGRNDDSIIHIIIAIIVIEAKNNLQS